MPHTTTTMTTTTSATPIHLLTPALMIGGAHLPFRHVAAGQAFSIELTAIHPGDALVWAYGIKTPYERSVHRLAAPFEVGREPTHCLLHLAPFANTPVPGEYPFTFWLIDRDGRGSNVVRASVIIR